MKELTLNDTHIWYDPALLSESPEACFSADYWQQQGKISGSAKGRGTTWFIRGKELEMALRHYRRGGLFGKLVSDSYLFTGWESTRSYQEYVLLKWLAEQGVNVPRPVAARAVKAGLAYKADILVEKVPMAKDLVHLLEEESLPEEMYRQIGVMIAQMHQAGVNHTDLNIHNILVDADQKVWIIDFDKCARQSGDSWHQDNLSRLKRSFYKEQERRSIHWQEGEWSALLQGYEEAKLACVTD
ncbi:3-deoxy-D-manno-octulosonic acid kinase [Parasalinivibrio latis]|uniref:3-deoxy-D-manno-octulosonic acid kinase n=1 Tax=Parasalinivibrio latis TaxID=2952610 RepID=UPI0030E2A6A5